MPRTPAPRPNLWQRLLGVAPLRPTRPDPADMGTAIALDYLLDEHPTHVSNPVGWQLGALVQMDTTHQGR